MPTSSWPLISSEPGPEPPGKSDPLCPTTTPSTTAAGAALHRSTRIGMDKIGVNFVGVASGGAVADATR
eukprot:CAMPEP_0170339530 /NCGR_PEP_ID=MMETSP0116_2-20130129/70824_1 /TAXON_ID=400756 /ORGANISM="Durinskia baltica, Strain CSIRO CS-38" /LENGTH=68 /DNA_ID=CAMNT_0010592951 /DNA_START=20 /DNA_END=223 /DNA_ORIENTATION=+